jgi:hypothetical protein
MQNYKTVAIQRLRSVALDEREAPEERLRAAAKLLVDFGASDRNVPILNKVIRLYERDSHVLVAERAQKLKLKLARARGLRAEAKAIELPESEPTGLKSTSLETSLAIASISEAQKGSVISYDELSGRIVSTMGHAIWQQLHEPECSLGVDQGTEILHAASGKVFLWGEDVQALLVSLDKLSAEKLPALVRIAEDYLKRVQVLFDKFKQMMKEDQPGAAK